MPFDPIVLAFLLIGGLILYGIWTTAQPSWPIKIVVRRRRVVSIRGLPEARVGRVVEFLEEDVAPESRLVIQAAHAQSGRLMTKVSGAVDEGTRQRIRNFMHAEL
ncbi:hypothetical protein [Aeoliella sp.]|uniref:hypothetical protein n=1 Tax=Aeoliella sp. TaxID=2795800 RepID=UPI003CCB8EB9